MLNRAAQLRSVAAQAMQPFNVAVTGRMKTGKSTLINALVGEPVALSDVEEATATVNWLTYGKGEQTRQFLVHWNDGRTEPLDRERLAEWAGKTAEVIDRVRHTGWLQFFADVEVLREFQIIDTPGTGSAVDAHEEVAQEFLNPHLFATSFSEGKKADAIIYVVPPVGRESDEDNLRLFSSGRLPDAGPYNSVCVLHKWDAIDAEDPFVAAVEKADRLAEQLVGDVAAVIPVSGPLALAARHAPESWIGELLALLNAISPQDRIRSLRTSDRWDRDEQRSVHRCAYPLPWASFQLIVRVLAEAECMSVPEAREVLLHKSGIARLESFLRDRFFYQSAIIKRRQTLRRAADLLTPALVDLRKMTESLERDARMMEDGLTPRSEAAASWLAAKRASARAEHARLAEDMITFDREWLHHRGELEMAERDLAVPQFVESQSELFDVNASRQMCWVVAALSSPDQRRRLGHRPGPTFAELQSLIETTHGAMAGAFSRQRMMLDHLLRRLGEAARCIEENAR